jgi:anhydro-N-acetylmuramic acid kinase
MKKSPNGYLKKQLKLSDEFAIPAAFKEAIKFATLAHATANGLANNTTAASGASRFEILRKLAQPLRLAAVALDR